MQKCMKTYVSCYTNYTVCSQIYISAWNEKKMKNIYIFMMNKCNAKRGFHRRGPKIMTFKFDLVT